MSQKLIIAGVAAVVGIALGGLGTYWYFFQSPASKSSHSEEIAPQSEEATPPPVNQEFNNKEISVKDVQDNIGKLVGSKTKAIIPGKIFSPNDKDYFVLDQKSGGSLLLDLAKYKGNIKDLRDKDVKVTGSISVLKTQEGQQTIGIQVDSISR